MRILAVSDLHGNLPLIPECDLLLLGGDYSFSREKGKSYELGLPSADRFADWLKSLKATYVVAIAGNHDFSLLDDDFARTLPWIYLKDESVEIEGIKIYGTPWVPKFFDWAFMKEDAELKDIFSKIPEGLDILLSHGPAYQILDRNNRGIHCGSKSLRDKITEVKPKIMISGHIHEARGYTEVGDTKFYCVSYVGGNNEPKYNAVNIKLEGK